MMSTQKSAPNLHRVMRDFSEDNDALMHASSLCGLLAPSECARPVSACTPKTIHSGHGQSVSNAARPRNKSFRAKSFAGPDRCIQCGSQAVERSSFDHNCPKCGVLVCYNCVDDFRLIIASYQCPQCGDEEANQALLTNTAWLRNVFRKAKTAYFSFGESWKALFTADAEDRTSKLEGITPLHRCCATSTALSTDSAQVNVDAMCPSLTYSRAPPGPAPSRRPQTQAFPPFEVGAPVTGAASTPPDHRTRLPAGWTEAMGAHWLANNGSAADFQTLMPGPQRQ